MRRFKVHLVIVWLVSCFLVSAHAGLIYHNTRVWAIDGPGGLYGLVESQGDPISPQSHTVYETTVCLGPLYTRLPCRAPAAVLISTFVLVFVCWLVRYAAKYLTRVEGGGVGS